MRRPPSSAASTKVTGPPTPKVGAANDQAVYNRVEYWVERESFHPIKGKFYSDSGRVLKIIYYRNFGERLGGIRPTEAIIIDSETSPAAGRASANSNPGARAKPVITPSCRLMLASRSPALATKP